MARAAILEAAIDSYGRAQAGATATVTNRATGAAAIVYTTEAGVTPYTQPLTADARGRFAGFLDSGSYNLNITAGGETVVRAIEASIGSGQAASISLTSSLPSSPTDGQEILYIADATNRILWHLRYRSASASAYKWEFLDGSPLTAEVETEQTTTAVAYGDLATVGPTITVPLAGDYLLYGECQVAPQVSSDTLHATLKLGAAAAADTERICRFSEVGISILGAGKNGNTIKRTIAAASTAVLMQYKTTSAGTGRFSKRRLAIVPVRVG